MLPLRLRLVEGHTARRLDSAVDFGGPKESSTGPPPASGSLLRTAVAPLAPEAWALHRDGLAAEPKIRVTDPSAPVLYFGDLSAYEESGLRVVTVGVNPSGEEFPAGATWSRFPCREVAEAADGPARLSCEYLDALDNYFSRDPYDRWFRRSYEPVLRGLGASYYPGSTVTALHTDLCSALPTTPAWGRLFPYEKQALAQGGVPLWHRLIEELSPDIILASISGRHFARIGLLPVSEPQVIYTVEQKRPCRIVAGRVACGGREALLVSGGAATTPFQMINGRQKAAVGEIVRGFV